MTRLITVFGATGVQGGSVVNALLESDTPAFRIRAITRDANKPIAQNLASRGVELAQADLDIPSSIQAALQDSTVVFAVTNYWEKQSKSHEIAQGKAIADACRAAGVQHLIWSALPHVTTMTKGVLSGVEHFDSKAEVATYIEATKGSMVATYLMPGFYMQNIKQMIAPNAEDGGVPTLALPWHATDTDVALFDAARDMGRYVSAILSQPDVSLVDGLYVQACSEWATPNDMVAVLSDEIGKQVVFQAVDAKTYKKSLPPPVAEEMTENMLLVRDFSYFGPQSRRRQEEADKLLPGLQKTSWRDFVQRNGPWEWSEGAPGLYKHL